MKYVLVRPKILCVYACVRVCMCLSMLLFMLVFDPTYMVN